jgi:hypothetical protein
LNHVCTPYWYSVDREEALKDDYPLAGSAYDDDDEDEEAEWAGDDQAWTEEEEVNDEVDGKDESSAYLEFLNEEVCPHPDSILYILILMLTLTLTLTLTQAQKFGNLENDSDDELGEESLLETPLDKVEPYQLFRNALLSKLYGCILYREVWLITTLQSCSRNSLNFMTPLPLISRRMRRLLFKASYTKPMLLQAALQRRRLLLRQMAVHLERNGSDA